MPGAPEPSGRQLNQDEKQLLVWKIRTRKCLKKIHPQNGCPKSIFKPVESDQFQIGTHSSACSCPGSHGRSAFGGSRVERLHCPSRLPLFVDLRTRPC